MLRRNSRSEAVVCARRLSILIIISTATICPAQTGTWSQVTGAGPNPGRDYFAMTYDGAHNQVVVFGGDEWYTASQLNDTWVWDGTKWTSKAPAISPPPRSGSAMVFDQARGQVVLFGGAGISTLFDDTWVWDGNSWSQRFPASSPPPRWLHSMVYDTAHGQVVLFGGSNGSSLGDTWVWDGTTWTKKLPVASPPPRGPAPMAYDNSRQEVLLYGGEALESSQVFGDTWLWDGSNWSLQTPSTSPGPKQDDGMTYDGASGQVILFGGNSEPGSWTNETWLWNGESWTQAYPEASPPPMGVLSLVYDTSKGQPILFGGSGLDQTWVWNETSSVAIPGPPPPVGSGPAQSSTSHQSSVAEPVSTGDGNYYYAHPDFSIPARGMPLVFARYYNSIDNFAGPLGANWNHSYDIVLEQTSSGVATVRWGDGHGETYTLTGGAYVPQAGVYNTLVANPDGTFSLTLKNKTQFVFSSAGKLIEIRDENGSAVNLTYDGSGNLTMIAAAGGRSLTLAYDTQGRIVSATDPMGRKETYAYDGANNLASATDPLGGITTYAYDSNHRVTQITLPNGNTLLKNAYDTQGRVVSQTNGNGFTWQFAYNTPASGQTTITDARGAVTVHTYDSSLRIVGILDALGHTTSYTYDSNNSRTSVTNPNGNTTNFTFDGNGNVTGVTDPLSNATALAYDSQNDLLSITNPKGKTTTFSYDSNGNLTGIQDALGGKTSLAYDSYGELTGRTDAKGNTTSFSYGGAGDLSGITDALGKATTLAYDSDGRLVSVKDPNSHTATSTYDALGRLAKVADPLGHQTVFAYDAVGNLLSVTDANGHATSYAYDADNNLTTVTDALGHVTKYSYDQDNNRVGFANAKGNATTYQYDSLNRLIGTTDPLSFTTAYSYDPVGNVLAVTDAKGQTNRFAYDVLNRPLLIAYADGKNVAYSYDADGNRTSMLDWTGTTSYQYDALDRLTSVAFPGSKTVAYSYDANGRRVSLTYPDGKVVQYGYDADERLSNVTDWLSHVAQYAYDPAGNLLKTQYPNKASIGFAYDAANRLTSVVNNTVGVPSLAFNYTLDAVGNRTAVTEGGIPTSFGYDALNELTSAQTLFLKEAWTYDAVGNRLSQASPLGVTNYAYDASDRLLKTGTQTFTYDADGNQTSVTDAFTHWKRTYAFDAANRLVSVDGGLTSSFVYDSDGNRVSQSAGGSTQSYVNDVASALPVVLQDAYNAGPPSSYVYGLNLIESLQGRDNDFYQYDGLGSVIQLTDAAGRPELSYFYDAWGNSILPAPPTNPFRFTGQALDSQTGLYYMRARYYDPSVGRFTARDAAPGNIHVPQSLNRYQYVMSNPLHFVDPSGLTTQDTAQNSQSTPLALAFSLPNTVLNPQYSPINTGGLTPPCSSLRDCSNVALSLLGSFYPSAQIREVATLGALGIEANGDAANPTQLIYDFSGLLPGVGQAQSVLDTSARFILVAPPQPPDATTPSVAVPLGSIWIK